MTAKYKLQKYAGRGSRHTCPSCHRPNCFTLYVDSSGNPLSPEVGKCDHINKCGYHFTPRDYFAANSTRRTARNFAASTPRAMPAQTSYIPMQLVERSESTANTLMDWLGRYYDKGQLATVTALYHLGSTRRREVIYPQIDTTGQCRTGKIMQYGLDGHRVKSDMGDHVDWLHARLMRKQGKTTADYQLRQCLFGEHLLPWQPDTTVCVVEGEKTAVICAMEVPQYIWLSCGGCQGLTQARCASLAGRRVMVFPDIDAIPLWRDKLPMLQGICHAVMLSPWAEREGYPTPDDRGWESCAPKFDIADHIIGSKSRATLGQVCKWLEDYKVSPSRANVNFI